MVVAAIPDFRASDPPPLNATRRRQQPVPSPRYGEGFVQAHDCAVILEDTRELQCAAVDQVSLRTRPPFVSMADLVKSTLRLRPDRIIVLSARSAAAKRSTC